MNGNSGLREGFSCSGLDGRMLTEETFEDDLEVCLVHVLTFRSVEKRPGSMNEGHTVGVEG